MTVHASDLHITTTTLFIMAYKGEGSVKIQFEQWTKFFEAIESSYNDVPVREQQNFRDEFLAPGSFNQLWIQVFRDCLSESLAQLCGFDEKGAVIAANARPVQDRLSILNSAFTAAIERFNHIQTETRKKDEKTDEEIVLVSIKLPSDSTRSTYPMMMTLPMVIDIGRLLGFYRQPRTQSWIFAGRSYQMAEFCQALYNDIHNVHESVFNPDLNNHDAEYHDESDVEGPEESQPETRTAASDVQVDAAAATTTVAATVTEAQAQAPVHDAGPGDFKAGTTVSTYLRLCVLKIWSGLFLGENPKKFSINLLLKPDTIKDAISEFNHANSRLWKLKVYNDVYTIPLQWIPQILKTAGGWEKTIFVKRRECPDAKIPNHCVESDDSDCFKQWTNGKEAQKAWENYYSVIVAEAKSKAPRTDRIKTTEGTSKSAQHSRAKKRSLAALNGKDEATTRASRGPSELSSSDDVSVAHQAAAAAAGVPVPAVPVPVPVTRTQAQTQAQPDASIRLGNIFSLTAKDNNLERELREAKAAQEKQLAATEKQTEAFNLLASTIGDFLMYVKNQTQA